MLSLIDAAMVSILKTQRLDIEAETRRIREGLKSGDLIEQCHACERLSVLAENHFRRFLPASIRITAEANALDDLIRMGRISLTEQRQATGSVMESAAALLQKMLDSPPVASIELDNPQLDPVVKEEVAKAEASIKRKEERDTSLDLDDIEENERILLDFIIRSRHPAGGQLIFAQNIEKTYKKSSFRMRDISLELNRGEILGIVGVNASGKTTLLRILLGELQQSKGLLSYPTFENNPRKPDWVAIKRRIAYVSQTLPRWPGRVLDNLQYVASIYGRSEAEMDVHLDLLLQRYGLDKFKNATWDEISGGYKTRFEIVRALLSSPDILVLDEPLAYLDIISQQVVLRQLKQLAKKHEYPIGIVITSQQLYEIESIADRLLVLDGGNRLFSGPVSDLTRLIDDLVIEFGARGVMSDVRKRVRTHPRCTTFFATETGYIAIFDRKPRQESHDLTFNDIIEFLGNVCPGQLSYVRDISNSCRLLFEPRMAEWLRGRGGVNAITASRALELSS